jgi:hypothetical protein
MYYLYRMFRKVFLLFVILLLANDFCRSQAFIRAADLLRRSERGAGKGSLNIIQDQAIDTLLSRYILSNKKLRTIEGTQGIQGFRIQIYYSSVRNAREESARASADFINKFPEITSYAQYQEPGYFMVRAGNYRSRAEGYKDLLAVRKEFPNAYLVPAVISYPGLKKK